MTKKDFPKYVYSEQGSHYVKDQDELDALDVGETYESPKDVPEKEDTDPHATAEAEARDEAKRSGRDHNIRNQPEYSAPGAGEPVNTGKPEPELLGDGHTERDRLEMEAKTIGLKTQKNWTDETLRRKILEKGSE